MTTFDLTSWNINNLAPITAEVGLEATTKNRVKCAYSAKTRGRDGQALQGVENGLIVEIQQQASGHRREIPPNLPASVEKLSQVEL